MAGADQKGPLADRFAPHRALAQDLVAVLRRHGAQASDLTFRLDRADDVFEQVRLTYHRGRHGSAGRINLVATTNLADFNEEVPSDGEV